MNAETKASEIVAAARHGRGTRLKAAKSEAQASVDAYRSQKQSEFDTATLTMGAEGGGTGDALRRETQMEVQKMEGQVQQNSGEALKVLLAKCCDVDLSVPAARVRSAQKAAEGQ